ncbi:hypothetical protein [Pseudorhodobacter sp. E13]|uniref:hypothetical protein n=1 Tax=Pseudorhodobacter sp. E13 TaxID=2487931 RepID=UPI000F8F1CEA|nr:hypothetical protein [Pseudorhodobacter sp. E13]
MTKTDLVVCYAALDGHFRRLETQSRQWSDKQAEIARVERDVERILKNEEEARDAYARRLQARTETEDLLARMQKHEPGVSLWGYQSPARKRLSDMRRAVTEHTRAMQVAQERQVLAVTAAKRARGQLAAARARFNRWQEAQIEKIDPRAVELEMTGLQQRMGFLLRHLSEADIDEAVMSNRVSRQEAQTVRQALRSRQWEDLER